MRVTLAIVAALLVVPLLYGATYCLSLRGRSYGIASSGSRTVVSPARPCYWYDCKATEILLAPANAIDRQLRPSDW